MTKPDHHARISVTLPPELVEVADRLASRLDRSRSWVVAEALRRWQEDAGHPAGRPDSAAAGAPEAAVLESEAAAREARVAGVGPAVSVLGFRSVANWRAWKAGRTRP